MSVTMSGGWWLPAGWAPVCWSLEHGASPSLPAGASSCTSHREGLQDPAINSSRLEAFILICDSLPSEFDLIGIQKTSLEVK